MTQSDSRPRVLLLHDGELADVRALLEELGLEIFEGAGAASPCEPWRVVVSTPRRLPDLRPPGDAPLPVRIVVLNGDARTLRSHLRRVGVDFLVRRPFHPATLRLLLLRSLYRGSEKRRKPRVSVGAEVRMRVGLRRHPAILAELSAAGCRLFARRPLRRGDKLGVHLPAEVTGGRALRVRGEVVRVQAAPGQGADACDTAVVFRGVSARAAAQLEAAVARHASAPAALAGPSEAGAAPQGVAAAREGERRGSARRAFSRRVIALGEEAARVLIGRDLSLGGLRVEQGAPLKVGERVRLALHGGGDSLPLVVAAEVVRDDGERGFVLRFARLGGDGRRYVERMLEGLPVLSDACAEGGGLLVSELLDRPTA